MLTISDKKYMSSIIDKAISHNAGVFNEAMNDYVKYMAEMVLSRPSMEEVRELFHEEIRPVRQEMSIFKEEMILLRKDFNAHALAYTN